MSSSQIRDEYSIILSFLPLSEIASNASINSRWRYGSRRALPIAINRFAASIIARFEKMNPSVQEYLTHWSRGVTAEIRLFAEKLWQVKFYKEAISVALLYGTPKLQHDTTFVYAESLFATDQGKAIDLVSELPQDEYPYKRHLLYNLTIYVSVIENNQIKAYSIAKMIEDIKWRDALLLELVFICKDQHQNELAGNIAADISNELIVEIANMVLRDLPDCKPNIFDRALIRLSDYLFDGGDVNQDNRQALSKMVASCISSRGSKADSKFWHNRSRILLAKYNSYDIEYKTWCVIQNAQRIYDPVRKTAAYLKLYYYYCDREKIAISRTFFCYPLSSTITHYSTSASIGRAIPHRTLREYFYAKHPGFMGGRVTEKGEFRY